MPLSCKLICQAEYYALGWRRGGRGRRKLHSYFAMLKGKLCTHHLTSEFIFAHKKLHIKNDSKCSLVKHVLININ